MVAKIKWYHICTKPEKAMAPHSSTLAWKIPWMEEPGRLQSMGSLRVGHDWATSLPLFTFLHWRRKWQPTPVFLPGESQGRGNLVSCRLWGRRVRHYWSDLAAAAACTKHFVQSMNYINRSHWSYNKNNLENHCTLLMSEPTGPCFLTMYIVTFFLSSMVYPESKIYLNWDSKGVA